MKIFALSLLFAIGVQSQAETYLSQSPLIVENVQIPNNANTFRAGLYLERADVEFKGCVIYLEGLSDSVLNHLPLYEALSIAGYRTIFFDYMGQGGSTGSMSDTRLESSGVYFSNEIGYQARAIWEHYSASNDPVNGRSCKGSKKRVIGWSTGGLAGYKLANERWADSVALIAPGINPKTFVGTSAQDWSDLYLLRRVITLETLTRHDFKGEINPHHDRIAPASPIYVLQFSMNLLFTAMDARGWTIDPSVSGLVMVGTGDTYVDADAMRTTLNYQAPHFQFQTYPDALHELDNEIPEVAEDVRARIIKHFNGLN